MVKYTSFQLSCFPWIASSGTLREQDLLPRFWGIADQIGVTIPDTLLARLQRLVGEDSSETDWDPEIAAQACFDLFDILDSVAPDGFSFSSSEGDGACFGFWLQQDWVEALDCLGLGGCDPTGWAELIGRLVDTGIDPATITDSFQGRVEGWSELDAGKNYAMELADQLDVALQGWPQSCIDWEFAWLELQRDGYMVHSIGGDEWLVFVGV